jgi:prepilin-type N-terminal cleavage/methylation domain-containing protein
LFCPLPSALRSGFTLAESLVASVVLAIAVVGVAGAIVVSQKQTAVQEDDAAAVAIARQLMEEVAALPIVLSGGTTGQPGWGGGVTNPALYDTIDDYHGYTDTVTTDVLRASSLAGSAQFNSTPPAPAPTGSAGDEPLIGQQYHRNVAVSFPGTLFGTTVTNNDFAVATVSVQGAAGGGVQLSRVVARTTLTR